jgi:hypothetical protein
MGDMLRVIEPKSDQINYEDMLAGPITITITGVSVKQGAEQPVSVSFEGSGKVYRPCKSMSKVMVKVWGSDSKAFVGHSMTLYGDPKVKWGGMEVGGIRISHMTGLSSPMALALAETKTKRLIHQVQPLKVAKPEPQKPEPQKPADPPTMDNAKTQTAFNDAFEAALKAADGPLAVEAVLAHPMIQKAQTGFKGAQAERLAALIQSALARTAPPPADDPPADDDTFPGDRT